MTLTMNGTSHNNNNNKVRKSLATQLDRFDQMLDGLSEAIPEVVAETIRQATAQAVRKAVGAVLTEVLTNPVVLNMLRPAAVESKPEREAPESVGSQVVRKMWQGTQAAGTRVCEACAEPLERVQNYAQSLWRQGSDYVGRLSENVKQVRHFKYQLLTLAGVGVALALMVWC